MAWIILLLLVCKFSGDSLDPRTLVTLAERPQQNKDFSNETKQNNTTEEQNDHHMTNSSSQMKVGNDSKISTRKENNTDSDICRIQDNRNLFKCWKLRYTIGFTILGIIILVLLVVCVYGSIKYDKVPMEEESLDTNLTVLKNLTAES